MDKFTVPSEFKEIFRNFISAKYNLSFSFETVDFDSAKILYHFTKAENLEKIISQKKILLADYKTLNDSQELTYAHDKVISILMRRHLPSILKETILEFSNFLNPKLPSFPINAYISCFSESIENLALWRFYGDDGRGIAIGLHRSFYLFGDRSKGRGRLLKVDYKGDSYEKSINECITLVKDFYEKALAISQDKAFSKSFMQRICIHFYDLILPLLPKSKHPSFVQEKEFRYILYEGEYINFPLPEDRKIYVTASPSTIMGKEIADRNERGKRFIYSQEFPQNSIKEIWIGPRCNLTVANEQIAKMLAIHGYPPIEVKQYNSSYIG